MKEVRLTQQLESGTWNITVFEIGNTYQIAAENGNKVVHFMINKRDYLHDLVKKQEGKEVKESNNLSCTGREFLTESEFDAMKLILFTHMDADLSEEKFLYGVVPKEK